MNHLEHKCGETSQGSNSKKAIFKQKRFFERKKEREKQLK